MKRKITFVFVLLFLNFSYIFSQKSDTTSIFDYSLEELMNMQVVTAAKQVEKISDVPASVVVITREEIEKYGYNSLEDILQNIPGLYMVDDKYFGATANFGVRGFFQSGHFNSIIILVNGVNQMESGMNSFPFSKICVPVEAIDRIEVVRGPMSVIYGNSAFMGAINIITNKASSRWKKKSQVVTGIGNENSYKVLTRLEGKEGDFEYTFNAGLQHTDGFDKSFSEYLSNSDSILPLWGLAADATTKGQLRNRKRYFDLSVSYQGANITFSHVENDRGVIDGLPGVGIGHTAYIRSTNVSASYDKKLSSVFSAKAKFGLFSHSNYVKDRWFYNNSYSFWQYASNACEGEINFFYHPTEQLNVTAGFYLRDVYYINMMNDQPIWNASNLYIYLPPESYILTHATFLQAVFSPIKNLKFVGGLRFERMEKYDTQVEYSPNLTDSTVVDSNTIIGISTFEENSPLIIPRFAVIYSFNERHMLKGMYGKAVKRPSFLENINLNTFELFNLKPAEIETFEIIYTASFSHLMFSVSAFRNQLNKLLVSTLDESMITFSTSSGEMLTQGIELNFKIRPVKALNIDISATYQRVKNQEKEMDTIPVALAPEFLGYFAANYSITKDINVGFLARYVDKMESVYQRSKDSTGNEVGFRMGEKPVDAYFVMDFNFRVNNFFKSAFLNFNIHNLMNQKILYPTTSTASWANKGILGQDRLFLFTLGYKF